MGIITTEQTDSLQLRSLESHSHGDPIFDRILTIRARDGYSSELKITVNGEDTKFDLTDRQARMIAEFLAEAGARRQLRGFKEPNHG